MSKRRDIRQRSNPSFINLSLDERRLKNSFFSNNDTIKSKYIPSLKKSGNLNTDLTEYRKEKLFNKNISYFRQSFNSNDPSQLPFMSSLRAGQKMRSVQLRGGSTDFRPFEAGEKTTANQKIKKRISDMYGKGIRMTNAYYRWHNKSGMGNKQCTEFECTLRDYNKSWVPNPQQQNFNNLIKPIVYKDIQPATYTPDQLVDSRQKRFFNLVPA